MPDWFDGDTPCPSCKHVCFDHGACADAGTGEMVVPWCKCDDRCHFEGTVPA